MELPKGTTFEIAMDIVREVATTGQAVVIPDHIEQEVLDKLKEEGYLVTFEQGRLWKKMFVQIDAEDKKVS